MSLEKYIDLSKKIYPDLQSIREYLHAHPELSFEEYETSKFTLYPALPFLCAYFTRIACIAGDAGVLYMAQRLSCKPHDLS